LVAVTVGVIFVVVAVVAVVTVTVVETVCINLGVIVGANVTPSLWVMKLISLQFIPFVVNILAA
jgi:hypothetical protein